MMIQQVVKNQKGQVALFVALIFQVLFVFFAMLINVGLLVHHKINLQNSVDLAAYYGAAKQAENLNAIAHVNYQIRQAWKLLTFRYRQLGSYGDDYFPGGRSGKNNSQSPNAWSRLPSFCIAYNPFKFVQPNENYCKDAGKPGGFEIKHPDPVTNYDDSLVGNLFGLSKFQQTTASTVNTIRNTMMSSCEQKRAINLFALTYFIWAYKLDIVNRKNLILSLSNRISNNENDFLDLDGNNASDGINNTLKKNLTYQNVESIQNIRIFNSLGSGECAARGDAYNPAGWLSEINIYPIFLASMSECTTSKSAYMPTPINLADTSLTPQQKASIQAASNYQDYKGYFAVALNEIQEPPSSAPPKSQLKRSSLGYEKDPWCMAYVGVHAETKPQIPFSPFGTVTLKATAYAKPFGGTVGPRYQKEWPVGSKNSKNGEVIDPSFPERILPGSTWQQLERNFPDFPRYVGDRVGTKSELSMYHFATALNNFNEGKMDLSWWFHLILDQNDSIENMDSNGDMLAWGDEPDAHRMREIEIAAIAPDNWDASYYSVEPDFYRNYFVRLRPQEQKLGFPVRGDLGQRKKASDGWKSFSVKDQINKLESDTNSKLRWYLRTFAELLTSFKAIAPDQQNTTPMTSTSFGKCETDRDPKMKITDEALPEKATPGNCVGGGRVGYSVKLVDGEFLTAVDLPLGGDKIMGPIKNPPPSDWENTAPDARK